MKVERFSKQEFEKLGRDTEAAQKLADELAHEVIKELHQVSKKRFEEIVQLLNSQGHNLELFNSQYDNVSYFDQADENSPIYLRLAFDLIISSGYAHMGPEDETLEEARERIIGDIEEMFENIENKKEKLDLDS